MDNYNEIIRFLDINDLKEIISSFTDINLPLNAIKEELNKYKKDHSFTSKSLVWWANLSFDEQVKFAYQFFDKPTYNLTIREISHIYEKIIQKI